MFRPFIFSCFFLLIVCASFAQSDSLQTKKHGRFSFEVLAGVNFLTYLNTPYSNRTGYDIYGNATSSGISLQQKDFNKNIFKRVPTGKIGVSCELNKYISLVCGFKYSYYVTQLNYTAAGYSSYSTYYQTQYTQLHSEVSDFQQSIGVKFSVKKFYVSATLNLDQLNIKQKDNEGNYELALFSNGHSEGADYTINTRLKKFYPGAGANIGYELPLKKNTLKFELQLDYLAPHTGGRYYLSDYKYELLNPALCIGYKFATRTRATGDKSDSLKRKKPSRLSFEILSGVNYSIYLNHTDQPTSTAAYSSRLGINLSENTGVNNLSRKLPALKLAFNYKLKSYLAFVAGLKYSFFETSLDYYGHGDAHLRSEINDLQLSAGPKVNFKNVYLSAAFNLNALFMVQDTWSDYYGAGGYESHTYSGDLPVRRLCPGAGLTLGHDFPVKNNHFIKLELQCDYLYRSQEIPALGNYAFQSISPAVLVGFRF